MNYTTQNIEKIGFYILYELIVLFLLTYFIPIWVCISLFIIITPIIVTSYQKINLSKDSWTSISIFKKKRVIKNSDISLRRVGTSSVYVMHKFEVIIYEAGKEIGRIKFPNQKEFERFSNHMKEYNYKTSNF